MSTKRLFVISLLEIIDPAKQFTAELLTRTNQSRVRIADTYEFSFGPSTHVKITPESDGELFEASYSVAWKSNIRFRDYKNIFALIYLFFHRDFTKRNFVLDYLCLHMNQIVVTEYTPLNIEEQLLKIYCEKNNILRGFVEKNIGDNL